MTTIVYYSATIVLMVAALMSIIIGVRRAVLVQIFLLPFANVYIAGMCLVYSLIFFLILRVRSSNSFRIGLPKIVIYLWVFWLICAVIGFLLNGLDARSIFQTVEFLFYGLLVVFVYNLSKDSREAVEQYYICLAASAFFLSLLFLSTLSSPSVWPDNLIGRNEGAFVLVCVGLIPSLWLMQKLTGYKKILLFLNLISITSAIALASASRSGLSAVIVSFVVYLFLKFYHRLRIWYVLIFLALVLGFFFLYWEFIYFYLIPEVSYSNAERYAMLEGSYWLFTEKPFFGWGWGSVERMMIKMRLTSVDWIHPHSSLARFAVEMGISGLIVLFGIISIFLSGAIQSLRTKMVNDYILQILTSLNLFLFSFVTVFFFGASRALEVSVLLGLTLALQYQVTQPLRETKAAIHRRY
jgi:O-antigen ligase